MAKPRKQKARAHHVGAAGAEIVILFYTYRLCDGCPPDKVKTAIDKALTADETYFTKSINLALVTTSGASTGKGYNPHFPHDFDRTCDAIKLNCGESLNMSFAIVRGKVPLILWFIGGLYITIAAIITGMGFGMNHTGAQGAFYGLLGNLFSTLIMILVVLFYYH